jgi:6-pyruvoyltetrahydropterin/6-carboxytetrahydropterin synthase
MISSSKKCANIHGHNGKVEIELKREKLDKSGMVYDFVKIKKDIEKWIEKNLDHKMLVRKGDPIIKILKKINTNYFEMDDEPTAENIAKLIYNYAKKRNSLVSKVKFWETDTSSAEYSEETL